MIYFGGPYVSKEDIKSVKNSISSGFYDGMKRDLGLFENQLKSILNIKYCHLTFTCTHAMHLACLALGLKKGDEVIIPDLGWIATGISIQYTGAKCVFVDVDIKTLCIDPIKIRKAITKKTKAIMVVHLFGHPCDMSEILKISREYGLYIIEDAAPSLGSKINNKSTGTFGDIGCFSFQGSKIITTNEGGALVTNKKKYLDFAKLYSILGRTDSKGPFWSDFMGYRYGMSDLNASLGYTQSRKIEKIVSIKRNISKTYQKYLADNPFFSFIAEPNYAYSNYAYPNIIIKKGNRAIRDKIINYLTKNKVQCRAMFSKMSDMPIFSAKFKNMNSQKASDLCITLPSAPRTKEIELRFVIDKLNEAYKKFI